VTRHKVVLWNLKITREAINKPKYKGITRTFLFRERFGEKRWTFSENYYLNIVYYPGILNTMFWEKNPPIREYGLIFKCGFFEPRKHFL
jgi:hypothetical protein